MTTTLTDAWTLVRREWLRYRRDRAYWVGQLAFPLVVVAFIGLGLNGVVDLPTGTDYVSHLASGILALVVGSGGMGGGVTLIQDRESGFLRALVVAPVSATSIVLGKMVARALASLVLVGILVALFGLFTPLRLAHVGAALLAVVGVTACFVALGVALAARLSSFEAFRLLAALVTVPLYLLSGIFYPISTLPVAWRALAHANPLTYGVDLLRFGVVGVAELPPVLDAGLLTALTVLSGVGAVVAFRRATDA